MTAPVNDSSHLARSVLKRVSRRRLIKQGLGSLGLGAMTRAAGIPALWFSGAIDGNHSLRAAQPKPDDSTASSELTRGAIDAHVHVWTPDVQRYPLAEGYRPEEMKPASFTPQQLLKQAQPAGVSRIVLIQMSFYGFDNSYMLDAISAHPGVFSGVAVINDQVARPQDTMRALAQRGVRGFRLYPQQRPIDRWFASEGLQSMWRCGAQQNLAMCLLVNPDALPAIDKMCAKYPETPVVIDHFARIGIDGTIRPSDLDQLCRLARHKRTRVKVSAFYALGKKQAPYTDLVPMIKRLLAAFGPQRLMWATDCPYQVQDAHTYADSIALVRDHLKGISDDDRQWLLRKTAQRVFF